MGENIPPEPPIEYGNDCVLCDPGKTPKYLTVTVSGLQTNPNCFNGPGYSFRANNTSDANGTYVLTQEEGTPCQWSIHNVPGAGEIKEWTGAGCVIGAPDSVPIDDFDIRVWKGDIISVDIIGSTEAPVTPFYFHNYETGGTEESDCMQHSGIANENEADVSREVCIEGTVEIREGA